MTEQLKPCELTSLQEDRALRLKMDIQSGENANGFLAAVLLGMGFMFTRDIPTAAVDNATFYINPDFMFSDEWKPEDRVFVVFHEALHVVYRHVTDRGNRDGLTWNYAGDYRINTDLLAMGFKRPPDGLFDDEGIYADWTTDEIYDHLKQKQEDDDFELDPNSPFLGDMIESDEDAEGESGSGDSGDVEEIIRTATAMAEMSANGWGNMPGSLKDMLRAEKSVKVSWREELAEIPMVLAKSAYNYKKFSRRGMTRGVYNPLRESKRLGSVHVFWDTSISVSDEQISLMKGEVVTLMETMRPDKVYVHCFDTQLHPAQEMEEFDDINDIEVIGRGGTNLFPIDDYFRSGDDEDSSCILIFSDLYCAPLQEELPHPTFWIVMDNPGAEVNFGTAIHYDSKSYDQE